MIDAVDPHSSESQFMQIYNSIKHDIDNEDLMPGEALPSLRELAKRLNISHATTKRAYNLLEEDCYIEYTGHEFTVSPLRGQSRTELAGWKVFFSYVRRDDELSHGAITNLKEEIKNEYEIRTGKQLNYFIDRDGIDWGGNFRDIIMRELGSTSFFMAILSPAYLRSPKCINELKTAIKQFDELGLSKGIYPIDFVNIDAALAAMPDDELSVFLKDHQRIINGEALRYRDSKSREYMLVIKEIVDEMTKNESELIEAQERLERQFTNPEGLSGKSDKLDNCSEGLIDRIAILETGPEELTDRLMSIQRIIEAIGQVPNRYPFPKNPSPRMIQTVMQHVSVELSPLAENLYTECSEYRALTSKLDNGIDAALELSRYDTDSSFESLENYKREMSELVTSTDEAFDQLGTLKATLAYLSSLSQSMKRPCGLMERALEDLLASKPLFKNWEKKTADALDWARQDAQ